MRKDTLNLMQLKHYRIKVPAILSFPLLKQHPPFLCYVIEEWSPGYLHIKTFTTTSINDSLLEFSDYFAKIKRRNIQKLIIDVHGNDCHKVVLGYLLANFLVPHEFPQNIPLEYPTGAYSSFHFYTINLNPLLLFTHTDTLNLYPRIRSIPLTNKTDGRETLDRAREWTALFLEYGGLAYDDYKQVLPENLRDVTLFDPEHLMIVTDGRSGSTCALFTKRLTEHKLVIVIGLGGYPLDTEVTFDVASFAGGTKVSASNLFSQKFVPAMPRPYSDFSSVGINARSTLYDHRNESLEFRVVEPDIVLQYYPQQDDTTDNGMLRVTKLVAPYFDQCFSWEVNSTDCTPTGTIMEYASYGHPCKEDGKGFDETKCVFRPCKEGCYLDQEKKCSPIPVVDMRCNIVGGRVVEFSQVETCLATMEYNKTDSEYTDLIPTIKKYLEYYAYRDTMLPLPAPYEDTKLDILAELDALQNKTYQTGFDFYETVSLAIN